MTDETSEWARMEACIASALQWADKRGLMDLGIHLNSALLALDAAYRAPTLSTSAPATVRA